MDPPYDEQRLRNEVIFLHSLWHQGPPTTSPNHIHIPIHTPNSASSLPCPYTPQPASVGALFHASHLPNHQYGGINPRPTYPFVPTHTRSLPPINSTTFKKSKKKRRDATKNRTQTDPPQSPGPEWPCPVSAESPAPPVSGWPELKPHSVPASHPVSSRERERLAALHLQNKACQAFREFLFDSDEDEEDRNEDEDDGSESEEIEEFFVKIFTENYELRNYYQKCFETGEFYCLVCGAIGKKKSGKKFKDCVSLVQHSMSISRTMKRGAHRALGQAMCKMMGWDIDRLPTIVMKGEPLGCSLGMKQAEKEGEPKENVEEDRNGKDGSHKSYEKVVSLEHADEPADERVQGVDQTISECFSKESDHSNNGENLDENMLDVGLENGGVGAIDEVSHEPLVSGAEWVGKNPNCDSSSAASGWLAFYTKSPPQACSLSAEEQPSVSVLHLQQKALETCRKFLACNAGSDSDDDSDNENEDELIDDSDSEECEEFQFFLRLFTEDKDLRRFYENSQREGDFYCLVCGGIGKKMWKRFKDCIALLQHSTAIRRTKRKRAHRAYSQVICKVLAWDIDRLPTIVLKGETLGSSLANSRKLSGEPEKPAGGHIDDSSGEPEEPANDHVDDADVLQES